MKWQWGCSNYKFYIRQTHGQRQRDRHEVQRQPEIESLSGWRSENVSASVCRCVSAGMSVLCWGVEVDFKHTYWKVLSCQRYIYSVRERHTFVCVKMYFIFAHICFVLCASVTVFLEGQMELCMCLCTLLHVCFSDCMVSHVCACVNMVPHTHTHTHVAAASVRFKIVLLIVRGHSGICPPGYILLFSLFNKSDATPCSPRQLLHNSLTLCFSLSQTEWLNWCLLSFVL